MICGIYKITNKLNGKVYIGQSINIEDRWRRHRNATDDFAIHQAFRKYGLDNFQFEVIEECPCAQLDEREQYWIEYYNSKNNGYNMIDGGSNGAGLAKGFPIEQYSLNGEFIATYPSALQAAEILHLGHSQICACARGEISQTGGYQWKYKKDIDKIILPVTPLRNLQRSIIQYTLDGNPIREFASLAEAAAVTNISKSTISRVCNKKGHTAGGYRWGYKDEKLLIQKQYQSNKTRGRGKKKPIAKLDKETGEILETFESLTEASKKTGINLGNIVIAASANTKRTAGGFVWKYL